MRPTRECAGRHEFHSSRARAASLVLIFVRCGASGMKDAFERRSSQGCRRRATGVSARAAPPCRRGRRSYERYSSVARSLARWRRIARSLLAARFAHRGQQRIFKVETRRRWVIERPQPALTADGHSRREIASRNPVESRDDTALQSYCQSRDRLPASAGGTSSPVRSATARRGWLMAPGLQGCPPDEQSAGRDSQSPLDNEPRRPHGSRSRHQRQ